MNLWKRYFLNTSTTNRLLINSQIQRQRSLQQYHNFQPKPQPSRQPQPPPSPDPPQLSKPTGSITKSQKQNVWGNHWGLDAYWECFVWNGRKTPFSCKLVLLGKDSSLKQRALLTIGTTNRVPKTALCNAVFATPETIKIFKG